MSDLSNDFSSNLISEDLISTNYSSENLNLDTPTLEQNEDAWTPAPDLLAEWDVRLCALWSPSLSLALVAAGELFVPDEAEKQHHARELAHKKPMPPEETSTASPDRVEAHVSAEFWRLLTSRQKRLPDTPLARYQCVVATVWRLLRTMRQSPAAPFVEEHLAVALRAVRALRAGMLTPEVCAALFDFHRGWWAPYLTKPQLWILRASLAQTLAVLPTDTMQPFWDGLQSRNPMMQRAMTLGLEFLRTAHAVPHLLYGLEYTHIHATRAAIVDCLEEIADPHTLSTLARLRRETAGSDWTLSRQIARTMRVIEQQNPGAHVRTLLRPSDTPPDYDSLLLRPAQEMPLEHHASGDRKALLRPANHSEEK